MQIYMPFGYQIVNGKIRREENNAKVVKKIFKIYLKGQSMNSIAKELTSSEIYKSIGKAKWNHSDIGKILKNTKYQGDNVYPEIIDKLTFEKVQEKRKIEEIKLGKNTFQNTLENKSIFDKKIKCGECGNFYQLYAEHAGIKSENKKWKCKKHLIRNKKNCENTFYFDDELQQIFIELINQLIKKKCMLERKSKKEILEIKAEIKNLDEEINRLDEENHSAVELAKLIFKRAEYMYNNSKVDDYEINTQKIKEKIANIEYIETFDKDIFESIVKYITIYINKIDVELINGVIITQNVELNGKDENNGINQKNCSYNTSANKI